MQTVRRYSNRKYYHVEGHRYVTLADIAGLVRAGEQVRILDQRSGREITAQVLAQVIAREHRPDLAEVLSSLIRWGALPWEEMGWLLLAQLGLPSRRQWARLEAQVARLEQVVAHLLGEHSSEGACG